MDNALLLKAKRHLCRKDPVMAKVIKSCQPWSFNNNKSIKKPNHFHTVVKTIINQQLSVKAAQTIHDRLLAKQGGGIFNASKLQNLSDTVIRQCGLSRNKIRYIRAIAMAVINKELNFKKLERLENNLIIESLVKYPGILIISFKRLDVLPLGDLIIRKSMQQHYNLDTNTSYDEYQEVARAWQPYRTIASRYLWASASG